MFASRFMHGILMGDVSWSFWYCIPASIASSKSVDSTAVRLAIGARLRDILFAPPLVSPGIDIALNLYIKVFSLMSKIFGFFISFRLRSLNIGTRGLWSMASIRWGQPKTNILQLYKSNFTAKASHSMTFRGPGKSRTRVDNFPII